MDTQERIGYMCQTDFLHELGNASDGNKVYPSEKSLRDNRGCVVGCGIVKVAVRCIEIVTPGTGE